QHPSDLPPEAQGPTQVRRRFAGNDTLGYKVGMCERDVAIYGAVLAAGLLFGLLRSRVPILPFRYFLVLCLPMAVDGLGQLVGLWESTWFNRVITGTLFGMALVWLAYPYVQRAMDELQEGLEARLAASPPD
ncbi:MAG: DUF2085 domain-containing protein, partial [Chloroflexi bacterium]|nr:DUF2085 domain-containing protein [Chloroflexota bacterium]